LRTIYCTEINKKPNRILKRIFTEHTDQMTCDLAEAGPHLFVK